MDPLRDLDGTFCENNYKLQLLQITITTVFAMLHHACLTGF